MSQQINKMNVFLANQTVLYTKLHNLHWYVKGSSFFTLHAKFEELYDQTAGLIDDVAERLLMLGASPVAGLKEVLALATIKEREAAPVDADESVQIVLADFGALAKDAKEIIQLAADAGDEGTADQFTGYLRDYEKAIWLLESYLA